MTDKERYKQAFSEYNPSDESVEKIFEMTVDSKKHAKNPWPRRVCACVMAFALIISGGFGINLAVNKTNNDVGVIVAYASGDTFKVGSKNEQNLFYGIYVMPEDNPELKSQVFNRWNEDVNKVMTECQNLGKDGYTASCGKGSTGNENVQINHINGGNFALSLDDYSDVKNFKVENSSKYGILSFDYLMNSEEREKIDNLIADINNAENQDALSALGITQEDINLAMGQGNEFVVSGEQLRRSKDSGFYEGGTKHTVNYGYFLEWDMSSELIEMIKADPYFDLSQITDTITFTVEFNDGAVKTASIDLYFDSDGYMHFADE